MLASSSSFVARRPEWSSLTSSTDVDEKPTAIPRAVVAIAGTATVISGFGAFDANGTTVVDSAFVHAGVGLSVGARAPLSGRSASGFRTLQSLVSQYQRFGK